MLHICGRSLISSTLAQALAYVLIAVWWNSYLLYIPEWLWYYVAVVEFRVSYMNWIFSHRLVGLVCILLIKLLIIVIEISTPWVVHCSHWTALNHLLLW